VLFTAVASGLIEEGADLGSSQIVSLRQPRVAVLYGDPASPTATGWLAYLLEQELGLDYTRLAPDNLGAARLSDYDVLVFPDSDALGNAYRQRLGKDGIEHLQAWIESGGVFVGIGGGAGFAASEQVGWTSGRPVLAPDARPQSQSSDGAAGDATRAKEKGTPTLDDLPVATPGAVVRVLLDEKSFLTAGYGDRIAVPLASRLALTRPERGRVVGRFESAEKLRLAGFMWDETRKAIADQSYLVVEKLGEGKVILFAADPAFRAFWPHLHRLLLNALVVAPSI
jgi:hypothetical protein